MKKKNSTKLLLVATALASSIYSCKKDHAAMNGPVQYNASQTNLVADTAGFNAAQIDPNLVNAWGLAINPTAGAIWVSSNIKSLSTVYDSTGRMVIPDVNIPSSGSPTGIVFNSSTTNFKGNPFIFAGANGKITAWANGNEAVEVASTAGAVYTGITIGGTSLFATNFKTAKIDAFDTNFNNIAGTTFTDPNLPAGFAPFNIQNIGGMLYVTYAKQHAPDNNVDEAGPGNGYVDIFKTDGTFVKRFASQGTLNSPWGITHAPAGFAAATETILVGNFGDGKINIFDLNGNYKGQLQNSGKTIVIGGLWALDFLKANPGATSKLYFTAGPGEKHGIFGYLLNTSTTASTGGSSGGTTTRPGSGY